MFLVLDSGKLKINVNPQEIWELKSRKNDDGDGKNIRWLMSLLALLKMYAVSTEELQIFEKKKDGTRSKNKASPCFAYSNANDINI